VRAVPGPALLEGAARVAAGRTTVRRAAVAVARARGQRLALLYHRVGRAAPTTPEVLPTLPTAVLAEQLDVVAGIGPIVPLVELVAADDPGPCFAVTFDDDAPSHLTDVLPVLQARDVPATFFLSGRALVGRGAYWWEVLEAAVVERGVAAVARELGVAGTTAAELAASCRGTPAAAEVVARYPAPAGTVLDADQLRQLAASPMAGVAFHTVDHPVLPTLGDGELDHALTAGREALARELGARTDVIAYPHGAADDRVRRAAARVGFRVGCTTAARPFRPSSDPLRVGRWEPGPAVGDAFRARLLVMLNRRAGPRG
jgi:peptidoglycan/xylan/chitin deacetylase (PgdA/CDA1 family)